MLDFDDDHFAIYFHHGGKFETIGGSRFYCGGIYERKLGFEKDKFGYFDVVDEVEKLGYVKWNNIAYKIPKQEAFIVLKDDKDVMKMLQHLSERCYCISMYVDGGLKDSEKEIADEVGKNHKGKGIAIEGSKSSACDSTVTKLPKGSDLKHKGKANVVFPQKKDRYIDKGKGKVEGKGKGKERVEGKEKAEGKGKGKEKVEGKEEGKGKGSGSSVKEDVMGISSLWKDLQDFDEDSDSDISWYDSDEDDEAFETDDSLGDDELGSGDEEYQEARQNINQEHLRIDSLETEIP